MSRRYVGVMVTDATTADRDYTPDQLELIQAIAAYQKAYGRRFPTFTEVLEVARSLGYRKVAPPMSIAELRDSEYTNHKTPRAKIEDSRRRRRQCRST